MAKNGYRMYFGSHLMPVAPETLEVTINNKNETVDLLNGGEINIIKAAGLTDIKFDLLIPNVQYPFATYKNGFKRAYYYLKLLKNYKTSKKAFSFIFYRTLPSGTNLYQTALKVTLEDYKTKEDAENGFDVTVSIQLKQYKEYGAKTAKIVNGKVLTKKMGRAQKEIKLPTTHKVTKTDTLWSIAKKYYDDELKYLPIRKANIKLLKNPEDLKPGMKLTIPKIGTTDKTMGSAKK